MSAIVVSGLTKMFGAVRAVHDLGFTVEPGTISGFLGPNGAGKTTTLRCLLGLVTPTAGVAAIGGTPSCRIPRPRSELCWSRPASTRPARPGTTYASSAG